MTKEEILKKLSELKKKRAACDGTVCEVYGVKQLNGADPARANGCCNKPVKKENKK